MWKRDKLHWAFFVSLLLIVHSFNRIMPPTSPWVLTVLHFLSIHTDLMLQMRCNPFTSID